MTFCMIMLCYCSLIVSVAIVMLVLHIYYLALFKSFNNLPLASKERGARNYASCHIYKQPNSKSMWGCYYLSCSIRCPFSLFTLSPPLSVTITRNQWLSDESHESLLSWCQPKWRVFFIIIFFIIYLQN